jgi:hypothetical protein
VLRGALRHPPKIQDRGKICHETLRKHATIDCTREDVAEFELKVPELTAELADTILEGLQNRGG